MSFLFASAVSELGADPPSRQIRSLLDLREYLERAAATRVRKLTLLVIRTPLESFTGRFERRASCRLPQSRTVSTPPASHSEPSSHLESLLLTINTSSTSASSLRLTTTTTRRSATRRLTPCLATPSTTPTASDSSTRLPTSIRNQLSTSTGRQTGECSSSPSVNLGDSF